MSYTKKDFERFRSNELKKTDTFRFECQMCGRCCRSKSEPIIVTGFDVFRFSKALNMPLRDSLRLNCEMYLGDSSHVPVFVLSERMDGSCRLMRKGKCMVQEDKPTVCAIFPLGRFYNGETEQYHYFMNEGNRCPGTKADYEWKLSDWLENFRIEESIECTAAWHKLLFGISNVTARWDKRRVEKNAELVGIMVGLLYTNYQYDLPFVPQVEANMEIAKLYFEVKFGKKLEF